MIERLHVDSRSVLSTSVLFILLKVAKVISPKVYGPLPSMRLLRTDSLSYVRLQDGPRSCLLCFLHELAVETSSCRVIGSNLLLATWSRFTSRTGD